MKRSRFTRQNNADVPVILRQVEVAPICRSQRILDGLEELLLVDALFIRKLLQCLKELLSVVLLLCAFSCQNPNPP